MINISVSESVILIADISVIGISVYLLIGAPLLILLQCILKFLKMLFLVLS